jgi:predicted negative regulator of RcsB-dependent stress response
MIRLFEKRVIMNIWRMFDSLIYGKNSLDTLFYRYLKAILVIFVVFLLFFGLYFGRKQWISWRDQAAQKSLAKMSKRLKKYQDGTLDTSGIIELHAKIAAEKEQFSQATIAPYFLALQAQVFVQEGKLDQAAETLKSAIAMTENVIIKSQLETARALILLDEAPEQGIVVLQDLIAHEENPLRDVAQFYLGRYYWTHDNVELALVIWKDFLQEQAGHGVSQSPFRPEAEQAVKSLNA